jgi:predicted dithiol-disulfide oxidoreductase (DUF899 family)
MIDTSKAHPPIVDRESWQAARDGLLSLEKVATHLQDVVAASRRRLPMTEVENYIFQSKHRHVASGMEPGMRETLDRLEEFLFTLAQ